ncbi:Rad17-domain-containing protein [Decorospora gaudefroyi]|uniref:Rad17-domain-containing protein n=1 Tax=Decorospora gaudefroyi TaxID=184978 RepID=A0A6A5K1R0_9PLEO|nr:Rad17-domain-containing protein [Decorospora gaudefroyi]
MAKLRAARKKPVVLSSDSEQNDSHSPPAERPKRDTLTSISNRTRGEKKATRSQTRAASPTPSRAAPAKKAAAVKSPAKPRPIYKPITSFFSNVPRSQSGQPTPSPEKAAISIEDVDDILDSSDDARSAKPSHSLPVRKRPIAATALTDHPNALSSRQKFLRTASGARSTTPSSSEPSRQDTEDRRPWTDKYGPVSIEELAVHKRKVADVRTWLTDVFSGRSRKRLLLLKGPAGSGKTTTMSLLSKELEIHMHEWKNPTGSMSTPENFASATAQFEDFVRRTGTFGSLVFDGPAPVAQTASPSSQNGAQKQLVLVEEFPNTFTRTSSAVQSFRSSVLNYLAANTQSATAFFSSRGDPQQSVTPMVMIISETLLSTNTAAADSFTAHRLLGPEILTHPGVSVLEFNPIASTFMTKAIDTIIIKEARKSGRKKTLGSQAIQHLAELGDIRSAISSLEFLCLRGDDVEGWGANVDFAKKKKKGPKEIPMTKVEQESLEMVTQRESTLGIFHAVGRVVYNKRLAETPEARVPQPPNWLPEKRRPKASEVDVDTLIAELGTDTQTFVAALHENYVLSCGGADSEETIDSIEGCIDALSDADLLSPDRFGSGAGRRNFQGTSADSLRQDEMCFQTSVRGLLYNLPHPVKRLAPPPGVMGIKAKGQAAGAVKGNAYAMYYPASLRIWKQQEEVNGLLEMWVSRAQRGELFSATMGAKKVTPSTRGVDTWRKNASSLKPSTTQHTKPVEDDGSHPILLGSGGSARYEMLLERLPYLTTILRKSHMPSPTTVNTIRDIQKITSFTRNGLLGADEEDEQEDEEGTGEQEQWATDKPAVETPKKKRRVRFESKEQEPESAIPGLVEKGASLMLSDDDIED